MNKSNRFDSNKSVERLGNNCLHVILFIYNVCKLIAPFSGHAALFRIAYSISYQFSFVFESHAILKSSKMIEIIRNITRKYKWLKVNYLRKTPREKWIFLRNIGVFLTRITGVAVLDPNYKIRWYSYIPITLFVDLFASLIYTLWYFADDPLRSIQAVPLILGVLAPVF